MKYAVEFRLSTMLQVNQINQISMRVSGKRVAAVMRGMTAQDYDP